MHTLAVGSTVRVGNHSLTPEEEARGVPPRLPYVDEAGAPVDPDTVDIWLTAPTGETRSFAYPSVGTGDTGLVQKEADGRFYVDWTPVAEEDGVWRWFSVGAITAGSSYSDQDVFFAKRPVVPVAAP
jgi:hypothetical protein